MIDLRSFTYIDIIQPQLAGLLQSVARGYQPLESQASLYIEVSPGMSINQVTDIALKQTTATPGFMIVERRYGMLELHDYDQGQVRTAGDTILAYYGLTEQDRLRPWIKTSEIITSIEGMQATLINRMRHGDLLREGQTLYILECHPAAYAAVAANEAEKAAPIQLLEMRAVGAFGRLYLGGYEAEIEEAASAVLSYLGSLEGRPNPA